MTIEENPELHKFFLEYHDKIHSEYGIIRKPIRNNRLWQAVAGSAARAKAARKGRHQRPRRAEELIESPNSNQARRRSDAD
jgi:hypothetical protein